MSYKYYNKQQILSDFNSLEFTFFNILDDKDKTLIFKSYMFEYFKTTKKISAIFTLKIKEKYAKKIKVLKFKNDGEIDISYLNNKKFVLYDLLKDLNEREFEFFLTTRDGKLLIRTRPIN